MKTKLLFFTFLLIKFSAFSQQKQKTIGLIVDPILTFQEGDKPIDFFYSGGIFYDQIFTRKSGLNIGLDFMYNKSEYMVYYKDWCSNCQTMYQEGKYPNKFFSSTAFLKLPVNYTFTLNPESASGFKALLFTGFTINKKISSKTTYVYINREEVEDNPMSNSSLIRYSYLNLGFELRKNIGTNYAVGFGTQLLLWPSAGSIYFSEAGFPLPFSLNLKFGRNL